MTISLKLDRWLIDINTRSIQFKYDSKSFQIDFNSFQIQIIAWFYCTLMNLTMVCVFLVNNYTVFVSNNGRLITI